MEGSGGTFRLAHQDEAAATRRCRTLSPSSLACRLVPSGLRSFNLSRGSAVWGTLLGTGEAAALADGSWALRVLGQTKLGLGPARPEWGKGPNRRCALGAAPRGGRR